MIRGARAHHVPIPQGTASERGGAGCRATLRLIVEEAVADPGLLDDLADVRGSLIEGE
jgi:hypothetical protein